MKLAYLKLKTAIEAVSADFERLCSVFDDYALFIGASFDAAGFVVNAADDEQCLQTLRQIRADRDHWFKPIYLLQELSPAAASLSDGLVASAEQALAKLERFWQRGEALADLPIPQSGEERVLRYLFPRPEYLLEPLRDWRYPQLYHLPLLDVLLGSDAGQMNWPAKLHGRGLLEPVDLIDRVRACPQCADAHISFIDVCPSCQSIKISEQLFLHCHTCGNVAPQEHFLTTGALMCPKCYGALKHIGVDYDRALDNFSCEGCRRIFTEPEIRARCHLCDWSGISEHLVMRPIESLRLSDLGRLAVRGGKLGEIYAVLDSLNYINLQFFQYFLDWYLRLGRRHPDMVFGLLCIKLANVHDLLEQLGLNRVSSIIDAFAERLRELIRTTDLSTRTSDELLWLLLPHTPEEGCRVVLGRILDIQRLTRQEDGAELKLSGQLVAAPQGIGTGETAQLLMARIMGDLS